MTHFHFESFESPAADAMIRRKKIRAERCGRFFDNGSKSLPSPFKSN